MKLLIIDFIPYLIVLFTFVLFRISTISRMKKLKNKMSIEMQRHQIIKDLVELECEYDLIIDNEQIREFPLISESLKEIPYILDRVGCNLNLDNIKIVSVNSEEQKELAHSLMKECESAPQNIQALFIKKTKLVNQMAYLKYPTLSYFAHNRWTRIQNKVIFVSVLVILNTIVSILECVEKVKAFFKNVFGQKDGFKNIRNILYWTFNSSEIEPVINNNTYFAMRLKHI